ncbi:hypothetical protein [Nonomuraea sediminis]|uniref:hypothetical protein n=1 Tax=Nonomuraea sediminis TaxID=2835864 RepID=UPI001BDD3768|nr:hypothetical protein [Nonomuraea sediminis]
MPPRPLITGHARAEAVARPAREPALAGYESPVADHEIGKRRRAQDSLARRLYPALHAVALACSRLGPRRADKRTGLVVATSAADRHAVARSPQAFLPPIAGAAAQQSRRLDVLLAVSRFVSGGLAQDVAAMLGTRGPELCLPGDCGLTPLAVARLFIDSGRADAMVVVCVEPWADDPGRHEAVAVVIERTAAAGIAVPSPSAALATDIAACVPTIENYLLAFSHSESRADAPRTPGTGCAVRWAAPTAPAPVDPEAFVDRGLRLLDESLRAAGSRELGVVVASLLDLSPEHALAAIERGAATPEVADEAGRMTFAGRLRQHHIDRGLRGPYIAVTGIPGASLLSLAIAEDLISQGTVPAVAVIAGDWVGAGAARALAVLDCPDRPYLRSSVSALVLGPADDHAGGRRIRSLVARRDACDEFGAELSAHAPDDTIASGCTSEDLAMALAFIGRSSLPAGSVRPSTSRFLGADALACVADSLDLSGRTAVSVRNALGGSGVVLVDAPSEALERDHYLRPGLRDRE